jgi:hypothetical protein
VSGMLTAGELQLLIEYAPLLLGLALLGFASF